MNENLNSIHDAFKKLGIEAAAAQYSITEYSLNTDLSFKFSDLDELLAFLEAGDDPAKSELVKAKVAESGVDTDSFFYVNFYKPKVAEL